MVSTMLSRAWVGAGRSAWRSRFGSFGLAIALAMALESPVVAQDAKRGDDAPREDVEPFFGDAQQSIAIQVPGFRGLEPDISLRYRSSRQDDWLGVGWTLGGFSTIEAASPRRGTPKHNSNDIFILDGQELVACASGMASPSCAAGGTHATKIESYLRIKLDPTANVWEIWNREGTKITLEPVIGQGTAPYSFATTNRWAVSSIIDTHDNAVSYSYVNNDREAYPKTVSYNGTEIDFHWELREASYSTAIGPNGLAKTNLRLKAVDVQTSGQRVRTYALSYGAQLPTTQEQLLASVQMYGKDAVLDADGTVTAGTALPPTSFTYYDDPASFAAKTTWSTAHSSWAYKAESVQYADVNGDNRADRIFRHTNNQIHVSLSNGTAFSAPTLWANPGGTYKGDQDSYADVNGDGKADLVFRKSNNQVGVYLSSGTAFQAPASWISMGGSYYAGQVNVGDVNGDGKEDLLYNKVVESCSYYTREEPLSGGGYPTCNSGDFIVDQYQEYHDFGGHEGGGDWFYVTECGHCTYTEKLYLALSNGTTFVTPAFQYNLTGATASNTYHSDRVKLADVNGDGMLDVSYRTNGNAVKIGLSDGDSILPLVTWHDFPGSYLAGQLQYADVNGDGTTDALFHPITVGCSQYTRLGSQTYPSCNGNDTIVSQLPIVVHTSSPNGNNDNSYAALQTTCEHCTVSGAQNIQVSLSTGSDFLPPEVWFTGLPGVNEPDIVKFADFDGDGKADLSYRSGSNAVTIALSTGTQFTTLTTLPAFNGGYKPDQIQLADVNGDGKDDVIHRATNQTTSVALAGPAGEPTHALKSVTNVYGGTLTYAYTPSSAWTNTNLPFVVNTVTSVTADDGRGGVATTTYDYAGGLWDAPERRFLGFRTATATLPCIDGETACPTVTTTFVQDFGAHSKPEKIERRDGAGTLLTMVEQEYSLNGATIPYTSLNTGTIRTIHEGAQSRRTKTTRTFDAYANVIESTFHGDFDQLGDELTSTAEFYPNATNYIISLPVRQRQYEGEGTAGTMLTESVLYYDGATDLTTPASVGDLTTAKDWDSGTGGYVSAAIEYDALGNATATVDPLGRRSEVDYDSTYSLFPVAARNSLYFGGDSRQTTAKTWDELCGLPLTETDLNGQVTLHQYDPLCRGVRTDTPAGNFTITSYPNLGDPLAQYMQTETPPADGSGSIWGRSYLDGWGREVQSLAKGPSAGQERAIDNVYNARGALASVTQPYYLGHQVYTTTYSYDARDRGVEQERPDLSTIGTVYGIGTAFTSVTTTDEVGHAVTLHHNAYGRVVLKEKAFSGGTVVETYEWDLLGRLIGLTDDAGNAWSYTYDSLDRRLTVDDPDLGAWSYIYDAAGQLTSQTDAKGQTTTFTYDDLGRVLTKTAWNAATAQNDATTFSYDEERSGTFNVGQRTAAENAVGRLEYDYDADGRLVRTSYTIDGDSYVFETGLDVAGRVLWQIYPDGDSVGSPGNPIAYDGAGRTASIPGVTASATYDARGWVTSATRANGVVTTYGYSPERGWLESLETLSGATTVQDFTYQRRADGQILGITSSFFGESWTYAYDDLKRLISATNADETAYSRTYAYDTVDNITFKSDVGSYSYPLPGSPRPHAAMSADNRNYSYDANGNMVQVTDSGGVVRDLVWDGEDRPIDIDAITFHYGPDGTRWKKIDDTTGAVTLTLGEVEIQNFGTTHQVVVKYLPGSARRSGSETLWHHKDHLHSVQAVTDATGAVALRRIHASYGNRIYDTGASFVEAKGYVGERLDEETGLLYLNARYYDPISGRFISGDPSSPIENGVGVNRYAYAGNNPLFYSDPYGLSYGTDIDDNGQPTNGGRIDFGGENGERRGIDQRDHMATQSLQRDYIGNLTNGFAEGVRDPRGLAIGAGATTAIMGYDETAVRGAIPDEYKVDFEKALANKKRDLVAGGLVTVSKMARVPNQTPVPQKTYQTYTAPLKNGETYSGRTSGFGTPEENVANRASSHQMRDEFAEPPTLDKSSTNRDAIRGREQGLIEAHGGAKSMGGTSGNQINGISPGNPKRDDYLNAARDEFGPMP